MQKSSETVSELKKKVRDLSVFNQIVKALTSTLELEEVLEVIMEVVTELLKPNNWSLLLVDEESNELYFEIVVGAESEKVKEIRLKMGEGIAGWCALERKPVLVRDTAKDPRWSKKVDEATNFETQSIICAPIISKEHCLGIVELINNKEDGEFTEEDLNVLVNLSDYIAIALQNARYVQRILELTVTDDCTNLFNARHLHTILDLEVYRANRYDQSLSLIFIDLDFFKNVNDTHGHLIGSKLLGEIAKIIKGIIRDSDYAVRYGGDEFVVILPETNKENAMHVATRMCESLASTPIPVEENVTVKMTASFGVASLPEDAETKIDLIRLADQAMYRVKERSRNGVEAA